VVEDAGSQNTLERLCIYRRRGSRLSRGLCVNAESVRSCVVLTYAARARLPSPLQVYLPLSFEPRLDMETACRPQHVLLHSMHYSTHTPREAAHGDYMEIVRRLTTRLRAAFASRTRAPPNPKSARGAHALNAMARAMLTDLSTAQEDCGASSRRWHRRGKGACTCSA
jgi:hypothetical protein